MQLARLTNRKRTRAAAILLALWALFLLSAMVISWALDIDARLSLSSGANRALEAEAMACSGAEVALAVPTTVKPGSPVLRGKFPPNQSYSALITGEGGRLNLNRLLAGENPANLELLRKYLEIKGVDLNERDRMIDCLLDWVDPDNLVRLNGAEDDPDYKPTNGPLRTLDEVKRVRGWEEFTARPDWDVDFTLHTVDARIDINSASRDVLLSLPGMTEGLADRFLDLRRGPDHIEGTEDDVKFTLAEAQIALGFRQDQWNQLSQLMTDTSQVVRVVSVGKSGNATRTVRMVVFKQNNAIRLLSWKEL
ncbi:MAG: ral secretion pathway protein [Verrucomicrobiota bacterium]|jgi:general secretion pathway protein K